MEEKIKSKILESVHSFQFKRKTLDGGFAKFYVKVYISKENVISVTKFFLASEGNLPFKMVRKFKDKWLYKEDMSFREQTLVDILGNALTIIHPGLEFNIIVK